METHLTIKHLASYLPYGLKIINISMHDNGFRLKHSVKKLVLTPSNLEIGLKDVDGIEQKPILRPLSDLTKEIEVNGEKFIPVEWFEIGDDTNNSEEYDHGNIKLIKTLECICKFNISNDMLFLPYGVVKKLYEWHFDIHGLIEKGLAIDINTLNPKP